MLTLDYANCRADRVGSHGLTEADFATARSQLAPIIDQLAAGAEFGGQRWRGLVRDPMRGAHVNAINELANRHRGQVDNLVVLGIGGSALGNIALQQALRPATWNLLPDDRRGGPRLFVLDNVDPEWAGDALDFVAATDPRFERTLVNVISKSGETAETAAQFLVVEKMLREALGDRASERIVAVTDPERGTMRSICDREGYATLPVPDGVGGRFSVLSPVGLFSAAMCGIDIDALLDGAATMDDMCMERDALANPAAMLAWLLIEFTRRGKPMHVMMPYANSLYLFADWYRQLWAESLGKRVDRSGNEVFAGATPIKALGATDQHSQIQLYREGPNDKVVGFLEVENWRRTVDIPGGFEAPPLSYLQGSDLGTLLNAEKRATEFALIESERPSYTLRFESISERSIGAFIQLWQLATAVAGELLDINAFDQPAVETGKQATFGLMGREGYAEWRDRVDGTLTTG